MESDRDYFHRRASEERRAAGDADHPLARQAHLDMADRYEDLAKAIIAREHYLGLDLFAEPSAANAAGKGTQRLTIVT